jgi:transcriptional regulator with PAS, ATPase and Fis domain
MNSLEEQEYFYKMFDEMWDKNGEKLFEHGKKFAQLDPSYSLSEELVDLEKTRIMQALEDADGNQTKAAEALSIGRTCLIAKMKKYSII